MERNKVVGDKKDCFQAYCGSTFDGQSRNFLPSVDKRGAVML